MSFRAAGVGAAFIFAVVLGACSDNKNASSTTTTAATSAQARMTLTSPAFPDQGAIPRQFTCDGTGQSPPLAWTGVPARTAELVLTAEDPDAPSGTLVHWVLTAIPPTATSLDAGSSGGGKDGTNSFGKKAYGGPCPPKGTQHRYIFTLLALDRPSHLAESASASDVRGVGGAIGVGRLVGVYGR